jgi:outer membrane autotransporter protein
VTTVVGNTIISTTLMTPATNVTGGTLVLDTSAGPTPGPITVQTLNGNALQAGGGTINVINGLNVQTQGGHAFVANGAASTINITNASINTTGVGAGLAAVGGTINATGVVMTGTAASRGHGAVAESGGTVNLHAGTVIARGGGFNSVGLGASGAGSQVIPDVLVPVTMAGNGAMGVYVHDGGQVTLLPGSTLQMNGTGSVGVSVDNTSVALGTIGRGLTINLAGVGAGGASTGVVTLNGGNIAIQDLTVQGANAAAGAWARTGTSITVSGQSVLNINTATSPNSYFLTTANLVTADGVVGSAFGVVAAIPAAGLLAQGGSITSIGTAINVTAGNFSAGADAGLGGTVDMTNNTIVTTGTNSLGIRVDSDGRVTGRDSSVTTSGGGAALFINGGFGLIDLTNTPVLATGADTVGLTSLNLRPATTNVVTLTGGSLISTESTAVQAQGPLNLSTSGTVVTGGGGLLIEAFASTFGPAQPTIVQFDASAGSILTGDALANPLTAINLNLTTGSHWTGAALPITNTTVDPTSTWTVTADSVVTQQTSNAGLIEFTPPVGGLFKTLTTGNYIGTGGTLGLNTFLGTDGSPSDRLVINGGTATGNSLLRITNAGGAGALTTGNGILVVDTINGGTTVPGIFALSDRVAAGPYDYTLFRSSVDASNAQAWYLRSRLDCTLDPTNPVCQQPGPGPGPTPEPPNFRPETSLYAAIPSMTLLYGRTLLDTLHERVGDEEDLRNRQRLNGVAAGAWGRVIGQRGDHAGDRLGVFGGGPKFNYDIGAFQAGQDWIRRDSADGSRDHAGLYVAFGALKGDVTHVDRTSAGTDRLNAYSLGGYWTHFGPTGWYLDAILQGTWYDAKGASNRLPTLTTNGAGFAGSLEAGYPIKLGSGLIIEPQTQFVYQTVSLSDGSDSAATVQFRNVESFVARIGARFARTWSLDDGPAPRSMTAWFRPSLWNEFRGAPQTLFSSADGPVPFLSNMSGTWVELNAGMNAEITRATSLFANIGYQISTNANTTAYNGKMGLRMAW